MAIARGAGKRKLDGGLWAKKKAGSSVERAWPLQRHAVWRKGKGWARPAHAQGWFRAYPGDLVQLLFLFQKLLRLRSHRAPGGKIEREMLNPGKLAATAACSTVHGFELCPTHGSQRGLIASPSAPGNFPSATPETCTPARASYPGWQRGRTSFADAKHFFNIPSRTGIFQNSLPAIGVV